MIAMLGGSEQSPRLTKVSLIPLLKMPLLGLPLLPELRPVILLRARMES